VEIPRGNTRVRWGGVGGEVGFAVRCQGTGLISRYLLNYKLGLLNYSIVIV